MIKIPTVLILGAGASRPYGLPTAYDLQREICDMLSKPNSWEFRAIAGYRAPNIRVSLFRDMLEDADPPSVDAWLEKKENREFEQIGKAAIAVCLLKHERKAKLRPSKSKEDWYRILWHRLIEETTFESFHKNKLSVITFNYDRSFEEELFRRFQSTYTGKSLTEYAQKFTESIPIIHVYDSLGPLPWQVSDSKPWPTCLHNMDNPATPIPYDITEEFRLHKKYGSTESQMTLYRDLTIDVAVRNIQIIPEETKTPAETDLFKEARKYIEAANALYFLGFGFHLSNIEKLGIDILRKPQVVRGTIHKLGLIKVRQIERLGIHNLYRNNNNLIDKTIFQFLNDDIDFNVLG